MSKQSVQQAQRDETQAHALGVVRPDLVAVGIKVDNLEPGTPAAATYDQFVGRLRGASDDFQTANQRRPTDQEMAKIGQSLLMQGTQRGTGWLFGDTAVRAFQVDPSQFAPTIPAAAKQGIVSAWQARNNGGTPTDQQVAAIYMAGQGQATAKQPARPVPKGMGAGARPATVAPAPAGASPGPAGATPAPALPFTPPGTSPAGPLPPAQTEVDAGPAAGGNTLTTAGTRGY